MGKTLKISKRTVIKALTKEPLKAGNWVTIPRDEDGVRINNYNSVSCPVCAVGAVLRNSGIKTNSGIDIAGHNLTDYGAVADLEEVDDELSKGNYLNALSCKFEGLCDERANRLGVSTSSDLHPNSLRPIRKQLIEFVKENFPNSFEIEV